MVTPTSSSADNVELDWIQLRKSFGSTQVETTKEKLVRKLKENPLVPIGEIYCLHNFLLMYIGVYLFKNL